MAEVIGQEPYLPLEYGDLQLPDFSETEAAVRSLDLSYEKFVSSVGSLENLEGLQGSFALQKIDELVADFVVASAESVAMPEDVRARLNQAIRTKDWSGVPADSPEKFVLRELIARANRLKFQMIANWAEGGETTGLTPVGVLEYKHLMPVLAANDLMFIKMMTKERPITSNERNDRGMLNELAVVEEHAGVVKEVPFHEAYPEETDVMVAGYEDLLRSLMALGEFVSGDARMSELLERKISYYSVVLEAIRTSDLALMRKADALLPQQVVDGSDVAHFHHIEVGYMQDRIVRAPEIALRTPDLKETKAQARAAETKETMLKSLRDPRFADLPAVAASLGLLENSNAVVRHFLGSGMEMDLKPAGQILPNEFESRVAGGIDSSLDMGSVMNRYPLAVSAFKSVFGEELYEELCASRVDFDEKVGGGVASHELGHAVGLVEGSRERLGETTLVNPYIEEWKATTGGLVANYYIPVLNGELDPAVLEDCLIGQIMTACRYAMGRNHAHAVAYFRHSQMLMKAAEDAGALNFDGEAWSIDASPEKASAFFEILLSQYRRVMQIYGEGTEEDLRAYLSENLQATPFMDFVCDRIHVPTPEQFTPAELAKLPETTMAEVVAEQERVPDALREAQDGVEAVMEEVDA